MTTIEALNRDLDGGVWLTLLALADAHEEAGDEQLARGYRYLARAKRMPKRMPTGHRWSVVKEHSADSHGLRAAWFGKWMHVMKQKKGERFNNDDAIIFPLLSDAFRAAAMAYTDPSKGTLPLRTRKQP